jgi:hypothetical protein
MAGCWPALPNTFLEKSWANASKASSEYFLREARRGRGEGLAMVAGKASCMPHRGCRFADATLLLMNTHAFGAEAAAQQDSARCRSGPKMWRAQSDTCWQKPTTHPVVGNDQQR